MEQKLRIVSIMSLSLTKDKLTLEEKLESAINGTQPIEEKETLIKELLKEIVLTEQLIIKWGEYTAPQINETK